LLEIICLNRGAARQFFRSRNASLRRRHIIHLAMRKRCLAGVCQRYDWPVHI